MSLPKFTGIVERVDKNMVQLTLYVMQQPFMLFTDNYRVVLTKIPHERYFDDYWYVLEIPKYATYGNMWVL